MTNHLYYGDNLQVLRKHVADESIDLIYLDPPFNSNANYNILFKSPAGSESTAQIEAFEDTWHWTQEAEEAYHEVLQSQHTHTAEMLRSIRNFLGENDMMAYLTMMTIRLIELHRVLKETGSLYLHCDPTASHYLKIVLDSIFGAENYRNEITWKRTSAHNSAKRWGPIHDVILFYSKTKIFAWNRTFIQFDAEYITKTYNRHDDKGYFKTSDLTGAGVRRGDSGQVWRGINPTDKKRHWAVPRGILEELLPEQIIASLSTQEKLDVLLENNYIYWPNQKGVPLYKKYLESAEGVPIQDMITDITPAKGNEYLGYPTQKPLALLERIITASSHENAVVLDPFCGCGTAVHAAEKLGRKWIGIDITNLAVSLIEKRLKDAFPAVQFEVHGTPKDMDGAKALAEADKYQFQWWAVSLVGAVPFGGKKKGADGGIDGLIYFRTGAKTTEKAIVSVKGGQNVGVPMIRDLAHVIERENAKIGLFITLAEPTKPMLTEAVKAGFYESEYGSFPRIQILTIAELFAGKRPQMPVVDSSIFKKATLEETRSTQGKLDF